MIFSIVKIWKNHEYFCAQKLYYVRHCCKRIFCLKDRKKCCFLTHLKWKIQRSQKCPVSWEAVAQSCLPFSCPVGICVQGCDKRSPWHFWMCASKTCWFSQQHLAWTKLGFQNWAFCRKHYRDRCCRRGPMQVQAADFSGTGPRFSSPYDGMIDTGLPDLALNSQ